MPTETADKLLLSAREAASSLGISRSSFYSLLSSGRIGPMGIRLGGRVLFCRAELEAWVAAGCPARCKWQGGRQ